MYNLYYLTPDQLNLTFHRLVAFRALMIYVYSVVLSMFLSVVFNGAMRLQNMV